MAVPKATGKVSKRRRREVLSTMKSAFLPKWQVASSARFEVVPAAGHNWEEFPCSSLSVPSKQIIF